MNFVTGKHVSSYQGESLSGIRLTYNGLSKIIEIGKSGKYSKNCFIAMSFSDKLIDLRNTIKNAIVKTGYLPILIDEINYASEVTINDAIIAEIKKSKFLIADFTQQKHGVYFEAGFALGLKKPVIYLCHNDDFRNSHFDLNHYPHIIYKDLNELEKRLIDKIEAWIE